MTYNIAVGIVTALWLIAILVAIYVFVKTYECMIHIADTRRKDAEIKELKAKLTIQKEKANYFQTLNYFLESENKKNDRRTNPKN